MHHSKKECLICIASACVKLITQILAIKGLNFNLSGPHSRNCHMVLFFFQINVLQSDFTREASSVPTSGISLNVNVETAFSPLNMYTVEY